MRQAARMPTLPDENVSRRIRVRLCMPGHRLAGIRTLSEAIADGVVRDDEVRAQAKHRVQAKHIEHESIRLSEMIDELFAISKINAGAVYALYVQRLETSG